MLNRTQIKQLPETKRKLLDAGVSLMRHRGFNATTVDDVCAAAGVTKGGFFHYFKSKDNLAAAAVTRFHELKAKQFADAPFRNLADPLERVFGRLDFAKESSGGNKGLTKGCLIGMFAQELSFTHPNFAVSARTNSRGSPKTLKPISRKPKRVTQPVLFSIPKASRCCISPS